MPEIALEMPKGGIIIWSGKVSNIPSGWLLCNGNNGTPNLTDRFVIHADADSGGTNDVGDSGGSKTISEANLPSHAHTYNVHSQNEDRGHTNMNLTAGSDPNPTSTDGTPSTNSVGSGTDYMPKFYALAYIMKT